MDREHQIQTVVENISRLQRAIPPMAWDKAGLSRAQAGMLYMLHYHRTTSMKNIAEHLGISKSAVTQLMEPLLQNDYISREIVAQDRRSAVIKLTPKGLKTIKRLNQHKMLGLRTALHSLSDKELFGLSRLHAKMAEGLVKKAK